MAPPVKSYALFWMRILTGLGAVLLYLSLTACATRPESAVGPVQCLHPEIDPSTHMGLPLAVQAYAEALNLCNTLNGFPLED